MTRRLALGLLLGIAAPAVAQDTLAVRERNDSVTLRFVDTELRAVLQAVGRYLDRPLIVGAIPELRVSLETPRAMARHELPGLLQGLVEAHQLTFAADSAFYRVLPRAEPAQRAQGGDTMPATRLFVIRLRHARAADVGATVNLLFGVGGDFSGGGPFRTGTLSEELRRQAVPPEGQPQRPGAGGPEPPSADLSGPVTIVPDALTNSLLVRSTEADFAIIRDAVEQVDIRPLQVLIEVLIVEVRKDRALSFGADLTLPARQIGEGDATIDAQTAGGGLGDVVLRLLNLGSVNVDAVIRAAASRGDAEIVSRPVLLASNNQEARIVVGEQRPFVQVSRSLPTDVPTRDQVVQYRDVGTVLMVRPTINHDGYVALDIQQEVNNATGETQFEAPVISTRETSTRLLVKDGQTIVLGGLRDRQWVRAQRGVPVLSAIPLLGGLFGSVDRRLVETELFLFLTPRVLGTDQAIDEATKLRLPERQP